MEETEKIRIMEEREFEMICSSEDFSDERRNKEKHECEDVENGEKQDFYID